MLYSVQDKLETIQKDLLEYTRAKFRNNVGKALEKLRPPASSLGSSAKDREDLMPQKITETTALLMAIKRWVSETAWKGLFLTPDAEDQATTISNDWVSFLDQTLAGLKALVALPTITVTSAKPSYAELHQQVHEFTAYLRKFDIDGSSLQSGAVADASSWASSSVRSTLEWFVLAVHRFLSCQYFLDVSRYHAKKSSRFVLTMLDSIISSALDFKVPKQEVGTLEDGLKLLGKVAFTDLKQEALNSIGRALVDIGSIGTAFPAWRSAAASVVLRDSTFKMPFVAAEGVTYALHSGLDEPEHQVTVQRPQAMLLLGAFEQVAHIIAKAKLGSKTDPKPASPVEMQTAWMNLNDVAVNSWPLMQESFNSLKMAVTEIYQDPEQSFRIHVALRALVDATRDTVAAASVVNIILL